jgi:hypothetical protein
MRHTALLVTSCLFGVLVAGCGSSPVGDPKSAAMFVGTWTAKLGAEEIEMCGTQQATTLLVGAFTISLTAPGSGEILSIAPNGCHLNWSCNGNTATLLPGQSCQVPGSEGGVWTPTFTSGTLTLGSNEIALQDQGNATLNNSGAVQSCTFTQSGAFTN